MIEKTLIFLFLLVSYQSTSFAAAAEEEGVGQSVRQLLLSREGRLQVQKGCKGRPRTGSNSLRSDIPKNDLPEEIQRKAGADYFDADDDNNADHRPTDKLFNEIFGKASKERGSGLSLELAVKALPVEQTGQVCGKASSPFRHGAETGQAIIV